MLERTPQGSWIGNYADTLQVAVKGAEASDQRGKAIGLDEAILQSAERARAVHDAGNKLIFAGNGGSAAICSHMATDYCKNGNLRTWAMNDGSMLTCLGNDYGYEHVFAKQIEFHARKGDLLIAISSSGKSANIINAVSAARNMGCSVITLSGFHGDNPLRALGDINFYLKSGFYGFVEIGHLTLCHAILDFCMEQDGRGAAGIKI